MRIIALYAVKLYGVWRRAITLRSYVPPHNLFNFKCTTIYTRHSLEIINSPHRRRRIKSERDEDVEGVAVTE